jgi:hypothetical protein
MVNQFIGYEAVSEIGEKLSRQFNDFLGGSLRQAFGKLAADGPHVLCL